MVILETAESQKKTFSPRSLEIIHFTHPSDLYKTIAVSGFLFVDFIISIQKA